MPTVLEWGQWIGTAKASNAEIEVISVLNIEQRDPSRGQIMGFNPQFGVGSLSQAIIERQGQQVKGVINNFQVYADSQWMPAEEFARIKGAKDPMPKHCDFNGTVDASRLWGTLKYDTGMTGTFDVTRAVAGSPSPAHKTASWREFVDMVFTLSGRERMLFRGESSNKWPLRTSFHRQDRYDLFRYFAENLPNLRHQINAYSRHVYTDSGEDAMALLSLAQHHGYPTPFLDWTRSPFIAAFFAFDCFNEPSCQTNDQDKGPVRIFMIDEFAYAEMIRPKPLFDPQPRIQFMNFPAHNNPRYFPQQSVACFSNLDGIERFIRLIEKQTGKKLLTIIDIPRDQKRLAMGDLKVMGLTAASLFPGLDGVCRALRAYDFN
jgi:hypothetical protein